MPAGDRAALLLEVAQRYWEQGRTQEDIGRELHLTRWKVGRLLEEARAEGIVQITVVHPRARRRDLEAELRARFGLRDCVVVPAPGSAAAGSTHVALAAADLLRSHGRALRTLGVSWGGTLQQVAAVLPAGWTTGLEVVQVNGNVSRSVRPTTAADVALSIARSGGGRATLLPLPAIVEHASTRAALYAESSVRETLARARAADALLFSLGALTRESVLVQSGAVSPAELERLRAAGACGDVLGHYVTPDGTVADADVEARTVGLTLDDLRASSRAIAVASGPAKADVIAAALTSGLCSVLVTDEDAARRALGAG
ncbi:MAG: Transcriptional repressor of the fructose operon, DeoR family [uncultured Friedmanniella sp.]|uniref:Transcriptional repressor of the fructose operon, DeoR family n=1 Tax=uncultured Friedmanniella sp. TaxID=335381 RepID=A0A6J4KYM4_9ACTN|nr:MAG: Transcriptional repressor of the fructose operon, DeoR family [uncultured Friedmanniella sp.]